MNQEKTVFFYLILSIISAIMILILVITTPGNDMKIDILDKLFICILFMGSCILGISLAFKPNWINVCTDQKIHANNSQHTKSTPRTRQGHHPVCNKFRSHTIQINGMIHCAGCTGLACGASISILLMCLYFVMPKRIPTFFFFSFIVIGLILIFSNFVQIIFHHKNAKLHLFSNILLVIGFFLIVSGMFQLTGRTIFGILGIMISFLWLDTRILLSKLQHTRLCKDCSNTCKIY